MRESQRIWKLTSTKRVVPMGLLWQVAGVNVYLLTAIAASVSKPAPISRRIQCAFVGADGCRLAEGDCGQS